MNSKSYKDDYVRVLDFLPQGKAERSFKRIPIAQAIGEKYFVLLEVVPRNNVVFSLGERVYVGEGLRDKVDHISRKIIYDWLTPTAKNNLIEILEKVIMEDEKTFVNFFNNAEPLNTRMHKLETLPRIGKKHLKEIIKEREIEPFKSLKDLQKRVKNLSDPSKLLAEKIIEELKGESKYYLFVPIVEKS